MFEGVISSNMTTILNFKKHLSAHTEVNIEDGRRHIHGRYRPDTVSQSSFVKESRLGSCTFIIFVIFTIISIQ